MKYYPAFLDIRGRHCVVLGGDALAHAKVLDLLRSGASVTVIACEPCEELRQLAASERIRLLERDYRDGDLQGARVAVDASGKDEINRVSAAEAERSNVLLNVVDRPEACGFIAPAVVDRDPLVVAVSTSGESPYLAAGLRARLECLLGREWSDFVSLSGSIRRQLRARAVPVEAQKRIGRRLLSSNVLRLLRSGRRDEANFTAAAISSRPLDPAPGRVLLVGAGPGDPQLLTLAATEALAQADVVFHDALVDARTLEMCAPGCRLVNVGKRAGKPHLAQETITARIIEEARAGNIVVRLKGGDPFVFGRGGEEMAELIAAGVDTAVIPGVTAAIAAPEVAGIPLTLRGTASSFAVVTGHRRATSENGSHDAASMDNLESIATSVDTLVILMPLRNLDEIVSRVSAAVGAHRPAALIANATLDSEQVLRGRLQDLPKLAKRVVRDSTLTMIVGDVVEAIKPQNAVATTSVAYGER